MCSRAASPPSSFDPPSAALAHYLDHFCRDRAHAYRRELRACRHDLSVRAVHQLRIAIRQLLAALELLRAARQDIPAVVGPLRSQLQALRDLRNAQIQRKSVDRGPGTGLRPLRGYLLKRERRRAEGAAQAVESRKVVHRLKQWRARTAAPGPRTAFRLRRLLESRLRRAFDPLAAFASTGPVDPVQRHRVRVALREFHYLAESLPAAWRNGIAMTRLLSHLRGYRKITGQIHDNELLLRRLDRLIADKRLTAASVRPLRRRLLSENARRLESCPPYEQRLFRDALLARRVLRTTLPCNATTQSAE